MPDRESIFKEVYDSRVLGGVANGLKNARDFIKGKDAKDQEEGKKKVDNGRKV